MALCKLCLEKEADRKNTHYLTDKIIRSALNEGGVNTREKGLMFNISNNKTSVEVRFQRSTSMDGVARELGRAPNEKEIETAKEIPFSVDYVFCTACEKKFTDIENAFVDHILPQLRGKDFTGTLEISFHENIIIRRFFLLQIYRTAICDPSFDLPSSFIETLRELIFQDEPDIDQLKSIPLSITYTNTLGDEFEYTKNVVGIATDHKNRLILFNDFVIQVFERPEEIRYIDFYGINEMKTFEYYFNVNEESFVIKVLDNQQRLKCWGLYNKEQAGKMIAFYQQMFFMEYRGRRQKLPHAGLIDRFVFEIIYGDMVSDEPRYSEARVTKIKETLLKL